MSYVYPVNKNGETYGSSAYGNPNLIAAIGTKGQEGYIREKDFPDAHIKVNTPKDAAAYMEYIKTLPSSYMIPLYDQEGNVIGEFEKGNGGFVPETFDSLEEAQEAVKNGG